MSYLEKLLEGVDLEWKRLEDITIFSNGKGHEKAITNNGQFIVVNSKFISTAGKVVKYTNLQICPLIVDDVLIVMSDLPNGKALAKTFLIDENEKYTLNQRIGSITIKNKSTLLPTFFNYYLNRTPQLLKFDNGIDQTNLRKKQILDVKIPIPALSIQKEIVSILDTFTELITELTTELKTELKARIQQYSYYREQLFSFEEGEVKWKSLSEIGELVRGSGLPKTDFTETGIPAIHYGQVYTYYGTYTSETISFVSPETAKKLKKVNCGDVIITNTSENLEDVGKSVVYLGKEQAVTGGHATIFKPSKSITGKYFAYYTQTSHFSKLKRKYSKGTKVIDVSAKDMAKIIIPIPPLEEQNRIVSILDEFDRFTTSLSEGLPKEIELRKKQYEYYRNMILSFPKQESE
jgi:type I restriction enzyme S subunit